MVERRVGPRLRRGESVRASAPEPVGDRARHVAIGRDQIRNFLAGRLLAPYVGVSIEAVTSIIGTILAGIAVGAWVGGALADRVDPRRLIAVLLMLGGVLAIASIPIVRALGDVGRQATGPKSLFLTFVGFFPAAAALRAVPPAVMKLQIRALSVTGRTVGRLSAWSIAGALFGTGTVR